MLMTYLAIVVPFQECIDPEWDSDGYLFTNGKGGHWDTDKQSKVMARESQSRIGFRVTTASWRQLQVALDREFVRTGVKDERSGSESDGEDNVHDIQAGHSESMANNRYGRKGLRINTTTVNLFRGVSDKWQSWLGVKSRPSRSWFGGGRDEREIEQEESKEKRIEKALASVHGAGSVWRSEEQKRSVLAIVEGVSPVVCILPTGGGKTTVILVPALVNEGKTTVVITPYIALADDLVERCKTSGIRCMRWMKPTVERATVVVVVSETATSQEFTSYVRDLFLRECLGSVYFDEAHTLRTERHFRQKFELFRRLTLAVPWIFLTATLPPSMTPAFEESLAVTKPRPIYFRAATNRASTSYSVIAVKDGGLEERLAAILDEAVKELREGEKILVFCPSVSGVKKLAGRIKCCCYYSKLEGKSESLAEWKSGEEKVMVTTSALGAGLDVSGVIHVFHVDRPYGCIQFIQESGRGGRGGERVKSTIILEKRDIERLLRMDGQVFSMDNRAMREFIITRGCRRLPLSRYVDGDDKEVDCKGLGGERCDNCQENRIGTVCQKRRGEMVDEEVRKRRMVERHEERSSEVQENEQEEGILVDHIVRMVSGLRGKCTICWARGQYDEYEGHSAQDCEMGMVLGIGGRRMTFAKNSCCFKCCLPADMCEFYGDHKVCKSAELVKHWVEVKVDEEDLLMLETIEEVAGHRFEMDGPGRKELWKWMCKECQVIGYNGTNLFAVFCASLQRCNF